MDNKGKDQLSKAQEYAFLLLKFRVRSEKEIIDRLKKKKFDENVIKATVSLLKERSWLDDEVFAKAWILSRLKRPFGLKRIIQELKIKGISQDIIGKLTEELKQGYNEREVVFNLAKQRLERLKGIEPLKAKRRIYSYLIRRGFHPEIIIETVNNL